MKRFLPWMIFGVFVLYVGAEMVGPSKSAGRFDLDEFGRLPVMMAGRVQPIDSAARIGLLQIRGTVTVPLDEAATWQIWRPRTLMATEWLLEVLANQAAADARKIFPIQDATVLKMLGLKPSAGSGPSYYAFKDIESKLDEIGKQTARITKIKGNERASWEGHWLKLRNALVIYERLKNSLQPNSFAERDANNKPAPYDFAARLAQYQTGLRTGVKAAVAREHGKEDTLDAATEESMRAFARPFIGVSRVALLAIIPPTDSALARDRWETIGTTIVNSARTGQLPAPVVHYAAMSTAVTQDKPDAFNTEVAKYRGWLIGRGLTVETSRARYEFFYNRFQPFVRATAIYVVASVLIGVYAFRRSIILYQSGALLVALGFSLHTVGLLFDMMLEGRPPIGNWYALIVFAGWGALLLAGAAERYWRNAIGIALAAVAGLTALIAAHSLVPGGTVALAKTTMDISFWLAFITTMITLLVSRDRGFGGVQPVSEDSIEPTRKASRWSAVRLWNARPSF
jgi:hypothetical protein